MFHILTYRNHVVGAETLVDMTAANDSVFSQRNSHFIFSEPYNMLGVFAAGANMTDYRLNMPSVNAVGFHHVWPFSQSLGAGNPSPIQDLRSSRFSVPDNEEMAWLESSTGVGAPNESDLAVWIAPPNWNQNLEQGIQRLAIKATFTATLVLGAWSGLQPIVFEQTPRGGWYSVNAAYVAQTAGGGGGMFFRLFFPRNPLVSGRSLRPGHIVTGTPGVLEPYNLPKDGLGTWGRFHTFEPPQVEVFPFTPAGAFTGELILDVTYLGTNPSYTVGQNV